MPTWPGLADVSSMNSEERVELIASSSNGTLRDTAQRLLVEGGSGDAIDALRTLATDETKEPFRRIQALWTLDGLEALDVELVTQAARSNARALRESASRLAESLSVADAVEIMEGLLEDEHPRVRTQATLSIGELPDEESFLLLDRALALHVESAAMRRAVYSGLGGREVTFMEAMGSDDGESWLSTNGAAQRKVVAELSNAVFKRRKNRECTSLLALACDRTENSPWQTMIVLDEIASRTKAGSKRPKSMALTGSPAGWSQMKEHEDSRIQSRSTSVETAMHWPGKPGGSAEMANMSPTAVLARGRHLYGQCMSCHQPNGRGLPPIYPPLDESPFVTGSSERLARILLHGLQGQIEVHGRTYNQAMPAAPFKSDADYAAIMTYIRQAWDNAAEPVGTELVKKVRQETAGRSQPWTPEELEAFAQ